ncbi:leucine-rich repeat-containing protein 72 [Leucoraja erinacea]|uniref:leucine-rich repeat-containing protein 72 n=1 Tax=Leucoraja erinaceus TaxID=7782 RepID=UPI0024544C53|nr:leucine-rich repeat-containing protein 72 [Leucoraja erinacea]
MAAAPVQEVIENVLKLHKIKRKCNVIELFLAKEGLTEVPDLSRFKQLQYLWLNHNKIKTISSLKMNWCLKELYLQYNMLLDLTGSLKHLTSLQILLLHNNRLTKVEMIVAELKKMTWLHTLNIFNNPLTQDKDYRLYVIYHLPSVKLLDRQYVYQKEREAALDFCNQDRMRVRQSLAFGQRIQTHLLKQKVLKRGGSAHPSWMSAVPRGKGILKKTKKIMVNVSSSSSERDISKIDVVQRVKQKSMMEHSIFDWSKVPNAQQKRQGDELTVTSQIITQFR